MRDLNKVYTKAEIKEQLKSMKLPQDKVVLVHSSLRLVGKVEGEAQGLLDVMIEYFTEKGGLLCIPTHTWMNFNKEITLDVSDPNTSLGAFSSVAVLDKRGIRSKNPSHSMVVFGDRDRACEFIKDELDIDSGTHPNSCYGKIYRDGGYILLVGVAHNRNTYLHCVEELIGMSNRLAKEAENVTVKTEDGQVVKSKIRPHRTDFTSDVSLRFVKYETAFRYHGAIVDGFVGNAPTQACDARIMKDVMELIYKRGNGVDPLLDEKSIPPMLYR
ncbi:MAG: AAC(3) family N-acetyltransferase [Clostridiales bacterium]|nr:AAC(3) family N-acetyltransferase [Clostridiales bacterium]